MHYFPSKKVIAVAFSGLAILAWVMFDSSSLTKLRNGAGAVLGVAESSSPLPDSDNDGLFDWQENLLGINTHDSDSDNDGVLDGEQYASIKSIPRVEATDDVLNYLSQLGNTVANGAPTPSIPEPTLVIPKDFYANRDITITNTDIATASQYVVDFVEVLGNYSDVFEMDRLGIISHWLETKDRSDIDELKKMSAGLKALSSDLSDILVPIVFSDTHLELINSLYAEGDALNDIEITNRNPAQGFLSAATYTNFRSKRVAAIVEITQLTNSILGS